MAPPTKRGTVAKSDVSEGVRQKRAPPSASFVKAKAVFEPGQGQVQGRSDARQTKGSVGASGSVSKEFKALRDKFEKLSAGPVISSKTISTGMAEAQGPSSVTSPKKSSTESGKIFFGALRRSIEKQGVLPISLQQGREQSVRQEGTISVATGHTFDEEQAEAESVATGHTFDEEQAEAESVATGHTFDEEQAGDGFSIGSIIDTLPDESPLHARALPRDSAAAEAPDINTASEEHSVGEVEDIEGKKAAALAKQQAAARAKLVSETVRPVPAALDETNKTSDLASGGEEEVPAGQEGWEVRKLGPLEGQQAEDTEPAADTTSESQIGLLAQVRGLVRRIWSGVKTILSFRSHAKKPASTTAINLSLSSVSPARTTTFTPGREEVDTGQKISSEIGDETKEKQIQIQIQLPSAIENPADLLPDEWKGNYAITGILKSENGSIAFAKFIHKELLEGKFKDEITNLNKWLKEVVTDLTTNSQLWEKSSYGGEYGSIVDSIILTRLFQAEKGSEEERYYGYLHDQLMPSLSKEAKEIRDDVAEEKVLSKERKEVLEDELKEQQEKEDKMAWLARYIQMEEEKKEEVLKKIPVGRELTLEEQRAVREGSVSGEKLSVSKGLGKRRNTS